MEKIEFLESYQEAKLKERRIKEKLIAYQERKKTASAIQYTGMPHGSDISDLSDYIAAVEEKCRLLMEQMRRTDDVMDVITGALDRLDQDEAEVLFLKHIKRLNVTQIADRTCWSRRSIYRIYERGLSNLSPEPREIKKIEALLS